MEHWSRFIVTLFFGIFGVHKFAEHKIWTGVLYLFTGGSAYAAIRHCLVRKERADKSV